MVPLLSYVCMVEGYDAVTFIIFLFNEVIWI